MITEEALAPRCPHCQMWTGTLVDAGRDDDWLAWECQTPDCGIWFYTTARGGDAKAY